MKKIFFPIVLLVLLSGCSLQLGLPGGGGEEPVPVKGVSKGLVISSFSSDFSTIGPGEKVTITVRVENNLEEETAAPAYNVTGFIYDYGGFLMNQGADLQVLDKTVEPGYEEAFLWDFDAKGADKVLMTTTFRPKVRVCYDYVSSASSQLFLAYEGWKEAVLPETVSYSSEGPLSIVLSSRAPVRGDETNETLTISVEMVSEGFVTNGTGVEISIGDKDLLNDLIVTVQTDKYTLDEGDIWTVTMPGQVEDEEKGIITAEVDYFSCTMKTKKEGEGKAELKSSKWECNIPDAYNKHLVRGREREFKLKFNTQIPYEPFEKTLNVNALAKYKHCIINKDEDSPEITVKVKK